MRIAALTLLLAGCLRNAPMLAPPVRLDAGHLPSSASPIDLNGDRNIDLVVLRAQPRGEIALYLGRGGGEFDIGPTYGEIGVPHGVSVGDLDGDGRPDVVISTSGPVGGNGSILIFHNSGNGTLKPPSALSVGANLTSPRLADVNGDGKLDILVALDRPNGTSHDTGAKLLVLLGHGDGTFDTARISDVGETARGLTIGDFNRDGKPDVATADFLRGRIHVLLGDGLGGFTQVSDVWCGYGPAGLSAADVNRDGIADLIVGSVGNSEPPINGATSIYLGIGDGRFQLTSEYRTDVTRSAVTADLDGDGVLDIVTARRVLRGLGDGHFVAYNLEHNDYDDSYIAITDVNGDGRPDVIATDKAHHQILVHLNTAAPGQ
jgi:hypothetical protein